VRVGRYQDLINEALIADAVRAFFRLKKSLCNVGLFMERYLVI
jgi:hypothetical protein